METMDQRLPPWSSSPTDASPASANSTGNPTIDMARTLREAAKLAVNNKGLVLRVVLLPLIIPLFILVLIHALLAGPVLEKVENSYERSSAVDAKDVGVLVALDVPFFVASSVVWLFGTAVTILASASTHTHRSIGIGEMILGIKSTCKKILIPWLCVCVSLSMVAFLALFSASVGRSTSPNPIGRATISISSTALACSWVTTVVMAALAMAYPCFAPLCALSVVIAVVGDWEGYDGVEEATKLVKQRKVHAYLLVLILTLVSFPVYILFYVTSTDDDDKLGLVTKLPFIFIATALLCLTNFFTFIVFTLFYYECKHRNRWEGPLGPASDGYHVVGSME